MLFRSSGSDPAPKRENMFQDISPPKLYARPPSNSAERVSYRSKGQRFEGFLSAAIDRLLTQIVVTSQRSPTAISSAERANCKPPEEGFMISGASHHGSLNSEANLSVHKNLLLPSNQTVA